MARETTQRKPPLASPDPLPALASRGQFPQPATSVDSQAQTGLGSPPFSGDMDFADRVLGRGLAAPAPAPPTPPDAPNAGTAGHSLSRMRIFAADAPIQRRPSHGGASGHSPAASTVQKPQAGATKTGFIDTGDGANVHSSPIGQTGSHVLTPTPLPPATQVVVTGQDAQQPDWSYVTASAGGTMVRGYIQSLRINTSLPEPTARLHQIKSGEALEPIANSIYHGVVRPGRDLRFYENAVLYINQQQGRVGIHKTGNGIELVDGHRIWLISPAFANTLQGIVASGSLTGGAWANASHKFKEVGKHLSDTLASVEESPQHFGQVAGQYAEAISQHLPEIIGIVVAFIGAEALSTFLAATPTGIGQVAAALIQLLLAFLGAAAAIEAGVHALDFGRQWLMTAWEADGDPKQIGIASEYFIHMLVQVAMAALAAVGAKGNMGKFSKLADSVHIGPTPAFAVVGGGRYGGGAAISGDAVALGGPSYMTGIGPAGAQVRPEPRSAGGGSSSSEAAENALEQKLANKSLTPEQIEALLQKTPNWGRIKDLIGRRIPPPNTPEYAGFVRDLQDAGYRLDAPKGGLKNFRLVRPEGEAGGKAYAPLTVSEDGIVVLKTGGSSRISVPSRYRSNYLQHIRQTEGAAGLRAAEGRLANGNAIPPQSDPELGRPEEFLWCGRRWSEIPGYTIDRGTNILDMPNVHTPPGDVVHLGSHPSFNDYVTGLLNQSAETLTGRGMRALDSVTPAELERATAG